MYYPVRFRPDPRKAEMSRFTFVATILILIISVVLLAISTIKLNDCSAEPRLPFWLLCIGAFLLFERVHFMKSAPRAPRYAPDDEETGNSDSGHEIRKVEGLEHKWKELKWNNPKSVQFAWGLAFATIFGVYALHRVYSGAECHVDCAACSKWITIPSLVFCATYSLIFLVFLLFLTVFKIRKCCFVN